METIPARSTISSHTIPVDLFMDTARILLASGINWKLESINEKENSFLIQVATEPQSTLHRKAMENMQSILSDYEYYLKGSPNSNMEEYQ